MTAIANRLALFLTSKRTCLFLVEESEHTASSLLTASLLVVHDTLGGGQHDVAKLTRGQQVADPLLNLRQADIVARADHTALVDTSSELHDNLVAPVVINDLKIANVAVLLHHLQELDNDLGRGAQQNLPLASGLGVANGVQCVVQDTCSDHLWRRRACRSVANKGNSKRNGQHELRVVWKLLKDRDAAVHTIH